MTLSYYQLPYPSCPYPTGLATVTTVHVLYPTCTSHSYSFLRQYHQIHIACVVYAVTIQPYCMVCPALIITYQSILTTLFIVLLIHEHTQNNSTVAIMTCSVGLVPSPTYRVYSRLPTATGHHYQYVCPTHAYPFMAPSLLNII